MCFGCSKEPSHRDGSFGYPQHMFWLKNKNINPQFTLTPGAPTRHGPVLQSVASPIDYQRVVSSIPAWHYTFMEVD